MKPKLKIQYLKEGVFSGEKESIGIHGIEGSFSHQSVVYLLEKLGLDSENFDFEYLVESKKVIEKVNNGEIEKGVFCVSNSGSGVYVESMFSMGEYQFEVLAVYGMEVFQCLVAHSSVKSIEEIDQVFAHPQAISQCERNLKEKYPDIKLVSGEDKDDTALCAKKIAEREFSEKTATLASETAAKLYGLNILEYGIHHDPFNTTNFVLIKKK